MAFASLAEALKVKKPKGGRAYVESWCTALPGFGIRVLKSGERSWIARYKKKGAKGDSKIRIEDVPVENSKESFERAQDRAKELRAEVRGLSSSNGLSIEDAYRALELFKSISTTHYWAPDTVKGYRKRLECLPKNIRKAPMGTVSTSTWAKVYAGLVRVEPLKDGSTKTRDSVAKATLRLVHLLYQREIKAGTVERNPVSILAENIGLYAREEYAGVYIEEKDMPRVWTATHHLHPGVRDYLLCLLFLGWRKSVTGMLAWEDVNVEERSYRVERNKRGNKAKITMLMPIPNALWELVFAPRLLAKAPGERWVIPSHKKRGFPIHEPRGSLIVLKERVGLNLTPHPFRYTFITIASNLVGRDVALELAMHSGAVPRHEQQTERYVREKFKRCVEPMNRVAAEILRQAGVSLSNASAAIKESAGPDLEFMGFM